MKNLCLKTAAVTTVVMALASLAIAQSTTPDTSQSTTQYFMLNLPAGVSLISSPLSTQSGPAFNTFAGLPADWPLFLGWSSNTQSFVSADTAPAGMGHGFWTYLPTPTTLAVAGQPFNFLTSMTEHAPVGWHLFGVPFLSGINWSDFKLYVSGNPIGLDTAIANGWIDSNITTMQGDQVSTLTSGQQFQPGAAYWVHTTIPLDVRADAAPTASTTTANAFAGATLAGAMPAANSTATSVGGWLAAVAETLVEVAEGAADFAEGNPFGGTCEFLSGGLGLVEHGLDSGESGDNTQIESQLTTMDGKLDTLLTDATNISNQLNNVEEGITNLQGWVQSEATLGEPMTNAEGWLNSYYSNPHEVGVSREWARWTLAGCAMTATACPEADQAYQVTQATLHAFGSQYRTTQGTPTQKADFPLWWAESVLGPLSMAGAPPTQFMISGDSADSFLTKIYQGLTNGFAFPGNSGTAGANGLVAYMQQVMAGTPGCATDISYTDVGGTCDLYSVYQKVEAYYSQAMSDQAQLMEAIVESYGVMTAEGLLPGNAAQGYMTNITQHINQEAEAFLRVSEQLALYRAADGFHDWNTFGSTDAGQLLARADFVVAQLAGQNYQATPQAGWFNPPWPLGANLVGRVFYPHGVTPLAAGSTRGVCAATYYQNAPPEGAFCSTPAAQVSESGAPGQVNGPWPYFMWTNSGGTAIGNAYTDWTVQRLQPTARLGVGGSLSQATTYLVNSMQQSLGGAPVYVGTYDQNYNVNGPYVFASLSSVEGPVGPYGLAPPVGSWQADNGSGDNLAHVTSESCVGPTCTLTVNYTADSTDSLSTFQQVESQNIQVTMPNNYAHLKENLPASMNVNVSAYIPGGPQSTSYWQSMNVVFNLADSKNNGVANTLDYYNPCGTNAFGQCVVNNSSFSLGSTAPFSINSGQTYNIFGYFWDTVMPKTSKKSTTITYPTANSSATWTFTYPSLTILK